LAAVSRFADILIALIALQHAAFLVLEMFLWTKPVGLKIFRMDRKTAEASTVLAKNQGLYNGFLAAGLIWALVAADPAQAFSLKIFFLACVAAAGLFGGLTAHPSIALVQALPAGVALAALWSSR
jgi:putative membrane protein